MYDFYTIDEDFRITFIPFTQEDTFSKNYEYWKTILTNELEQLVVSIKGTNVCGFIKSSLGLCQTM